MDTISALLALCEGRPPDSPKVDIPRRHDIKWRHSNNYGTSRVDLKSLPRRVNGVLL